MWSRLRTALYGITVRQVAWDYMSYINNRMYSQQRLNVELSLDVEFIQWLVGVTDGDGTFSFSRQKSSFGFTFKIAQSKYNARLLYYIKSKIGYGSITNEGLNTLPRGGLAPPRQPIFGISANIKPTGPNISAWLLETTNSYCIEYLIFYYKDQFKGLGWA